MVFAAKLMKIYYPCNECGFRQKVTLYVINYL